MHVSAKGLKSPSNTGFWWKHCGRPSSLDETAGQRQESIEDLGKDPMEMATAWHGACPTSWPASLAGHLQVGEAVGCPGLQQRPIYRETRADAPSSTNPHYNMGKKLAPHNLTPLLAVPVALGIVAGNPAAALPNCTDWNSAISFSFL